MATALLRPEGSQLSGETLHFMQGLWDLVHALAVRSKRMAKTLGVTGPQRLVIRVLGQSPWMPASDIARTLGIHPSTLTGILSRLEGHGLIERRIDEADRRRIRFRLTARGSKINREKKGTVEAAVRRSIRRAGRSVVVKTQYMLDVLTRELSATD